MKIIGKLLLTPKDLRPSFPDWTVMGALNPGAIRLPNKKIILFVRVAEQYHLHRGKLVHCPVITTEKGFKTRKEDIKKANILKKEGNIIYLKNGSCRLTTFSHFRKIILNENGFDIEHIGERPIFTGTATEGQYGVEDSRITKIKDKYLLTYVAVSLNEGVSTSLAISKDLVNWNRKGIIFREQNKDVVIFPEKIKGKYVALHRPEGFFNFSKPSIWISYSPDLTYWGKERSIIQPRPGSWEQDRIGSGAPPIKTKRGWLVIYHGVKQRRDTKTYSAGAVLLGLKNPEKILARSPKNKPLFAPSAKHEKRGFISNVVFPTGAVMDQNRRDLLIYSGGADSVISVKKLKLNDILDHMEYY
jgi:beta-1,2-mannobiose phosphorylase / 1,2-beta-oligomannan phosphorylase